MFVKLYPLIDIQKREQTHKSYPMWHLVSGDNGCENSKNCESGIFLALKKFTADHACSLLSSSPSSQRHHTKPSELELLYSLAQQIKTDANNASIGPAIDQCPAKLGFGLAGWTAHKVKSWLHHQGIHWSAQRGHSALEVESIAPMAEVARGLQISLASPDFAEQTDQLAAQEGDDIIRGFVCSMTS
jgi:hypothetical protein